MELIDRTPYVHAITGFVWIPGLDGGIIEAIRTPACVCFDAVTTELMWSYAEKPALEQMLLDSERLLRFVQIGGIICVLFLLWLLCV